MPDGACFFTALACAVLRFLFAILTLVARPSSQGSPFEDVRGISSCLRNARLMLSPLEVVRWRARNFCDCSATRMQAWGSKCGVVRAPLHSDALDMVLDM